LIMIILVVVFLFKKYLNGGMVNRRSEPHFTNPGDTTILVTGGNAGIGYETIKYLSRSEATLIIMAVRNIEAGNKARDLIIQFHPTRAIRIDIVHLDLSSLESIRKCVAELDAKYDRRSFHFLINNAGIAFVPYEKTNDGFEMTMATNYLGHFYLTNLMIEKNLFHENARIINVSSRSHIRAKLDVDNMFYNEENYSMVRAYANSKLANILFTKELQRRLAGCCVPGYDYNKFILTVSLHPGTVYTDMPLKVARRYKVFNYLNKILYPLIMFFLKSPWQGAQTTLHCVLEQNIKAGAYYVDCVESEPILPKDAEEVAKKLWIKTEEI